MGSYPFFSDSDNLNILSEILSIDADIIPKLAQSPPIGPLLMIKQGECHFPKHWIIKCLQKRYPNLEDSLRQLTMKVCKWSLPICKELRWHYRIQIYSHPLYVQFLPHRVSGLVRLVDAYLMAIHGAFATSIQLQLTSTQALVYVVKSATGWTNHAIAHHLHLSPTTIAEHLQTIQAKQSSLPPQEQPIGTIIAPAPFGIAPWYIE